MKLILSPQELDSLETLALVLNQAVETTSNKNAEFKSLNLNQSIKDVLAGAKITDKEDDTVEVEISEMKVLFGAGILTLQLQKATINTVRRELEAMLVE